MERLPNVCIACGEEYRGHYPACITCKCDGTITPKKIVEQISKLPWWESVPAQHLDCYGRRKEVSSYHSEKCAEAYKLSKEEE